MFSSTLNSQNSPSGHPSRPTDTEGEDPEPRGRPRADLHVAIIMDGNGRWAQNRRRPRAAGHVAGAAAVRRTVAAAPGLGITTLTLYAFSADNWRRPPSEVDHLMRLFDTHLRSECEHCVEEGVRLSVIGRRDRLPNELKTAVEETEARTRRGEGLHLRIAIDYSARHALMTASEFLDGYGPPRRERFAAALARAMNAPAGTPEVDLLIRTGGERRLSDFLLWESAYAELIFTDTPWPDFAGPHLKRAVDEFSKRQRRFGGLLPSTPRSPCRSLVEGRVGR